MTAFFETRAAAESHKYAVVDIGVPASDITIVEGADLAEPDRAYKEKGFFEAIGDFIMGYDDQQTYNEGLKRGGYLLTARVTKDHYDRALEALDTDDAIDLDARPEAWRIDGWHGVPARADLDGISGTTNTDVHVEANSTKRVQATQTATPTSVTVDNTIRDDEVGMIEVVEQKACVGKRDVSHGRVRVRSFVVEGEMSMDAMLKSKYVETERRLSNYAVTPPVKAAF